MPCSISYSSFNFGDLNGNLNRKVLDLISMFVREKPINY